MVAAVWHVAAWQLCPVLLAREEGGGKGHQQPSCEGLGEEDYLDFWLGLHLSSACVQGRVLGVAGHTEQQGHLQAL